MSARFLELSLMGDRPGAEAELGFRIHDEWLTNGDLMKLRLNQIRENPNMESWLLRAIIQKSSGEMVGHFNSHTDPNPKYLRDLGIRDAIEVGFTIYPEFRRKHYLTESLNAYVRELKATGLVRRLVLSIAESDPRMGAFVNKEGFEFVTSVSDTEGTELVFQREI